MRNPKNISEIRKILLIAKLLNHGRMYIYITKTIKGCDFDYKIINVGNAHLERYLHKILSVRAQLAFLEVPNQAETTPTDKQPSLRLVGWQ
jgi:hypothetical protein